METKRNIIIKETEGDYRLPHYEEVLETKEDNPCLVAYDDVERELLGWAVFQKDQTEWLIVGCWSCDREVSKLLLQALEVMCKRTKSKGLKIATKRLNRTKALGKYGFKLNQYIYKKEVL